jgi:hypothetical protein
MCLCAYWILIFTVIFTDGSRQVEFHAFATRAACEQRAHDFSTEDPLFLKNYKGSSFKCLEENGVYDANTLQRVK